MLTHTDTDTDISVPGIGIGISMNTRYRSNPIIQGSFDDMTKVLIKMATTYSNMPLNVKTVQQGRPEVCHNH